MRLRGMGGGIRRFGVSRLWLDGMPLRLRMFETSIFPGINALGFYSL